MGRYSLATLSWHDVHQPRRCRRRGFWEKSQHRRLRTTEQLPVPEGTAQSLRLGIPYVGSIWLAHLHGRVEGLKNTPQDAQPIMGMVFYGFRIMHGIAI